MRYTGKTLLTRFDALVRFINSPQLVAMILQIMRPTPEAGGDFQNGAGWQTVLNTRKDSAKPLRRGSSPRRRPFFTGIFPIVFHRMAAPHSRTMTTIIVV